ncbi:hypothetical protein LTR40_014297, partial [Exophiala xenobiotica]
MVDCWPHSSPRRLWLAGSFSAVPCHHPSSDILLGAHHHHHTPDALRLEPHRRARVPGPARENTPPTRGHRSRRRDPARRLRLGGIGRQHAQQPGHLAPWTRHHARRPVGHISRPPQDPLAHGHRRHAHSIRHCGLRPAHTGRLRHLQLHIRPGARAFGLCRPRDILPDRRVRGRLALVPDRRGA